MSTGLICIASNLCGSNEVIKDGVNGFLVDPSDQGILHGIEKALNLDDQEKKSIKQEARYTILENFEKRKSVSNILKLLDVDG
jgi:glycosyltransferase involved in cell wall biosynthesis